ncbi:MAG: tRNA (adenosine(37)-N6)-dimethylallyltransferase MiaA [Candidatus Endonucleobacter bathymodioli]|uniref:tRNA dimethylallyltransferase n=1 Tax=Candidatus Endonucleibacter bathymodioli TaxID=539814 RepID=A0AA90NWF0_9GAMM|nr:tRNA (adenosine(37)-N6)-dimethylallyltransferase MiaA [Candidatus Endonucleobacter bathymodioli]
MHSHGLAPAFFLMGPTASGKTDLAVSLTEVLPCEIISVDSALIYKDMDIGTAKPEAAVLAKAPHKLISFLDPSQSYSAAEFREDALRCMAEITARGRIPLLVGGAMLYFKVLQQGMAELPSANERIRERILSEARMAGWEALHKRLADVDPRAALRIKPTDTQRLQRALEVYDATGQALSTWHDNQPQQDFPYKVINLAISPQDRSVLHQRIALRFNQMLENNFEQEVLKLYKRKDLNPSLPSIRAVGYRQMWSFLEGDVSHKEMVEKSIASTRQLAKRQLTWLRSWPCVNWLDSLSLDLLLDALKIIQFHQSR